MSLLTQGARRNRFGRACMLSQNRVGWIGLIAVVVALIVMATNFALGADRAQARASHQGNAPRQSAEERAFLQDNSVAMKRMMKAMAAKPTGDVDRDFVAMMVPHHRGAVDMAVLFLRYGRNEKLRRLAQEIVVTQQQEIVTMRQALGMASVTSSHVPSGPAPMPAGMPRH